LLQGQTKLSVCYTNPCNYVRYSQINLQSRNLWNELQKFRLDEFSISELSHFITVSLFNNLFSFNTTIKYFFMKELIKIWIFWASVWDHLLIKIPGFYQPTACYTPFNHFSVMYTAGHRKCYHISSLLPKLSVHLQVASTLRILLEL